MNREFGQYRIEEQVWQGPMSVVYRAVQTGLGRTVSLKMLPEGLRGTAEYIERFKRESACAAKLNHPNIVQVYDAGCWEGTHYLALEHCEGSLLKKFLSGGHRLDAGACVLFGSQIAGALEHMHRQGVVHRDLKPGNIMILPTGTLKIIDFGIARPFKGDSITSPGVVLGTPDYMSPEQASARELDGRSDIYSLGVLLYEMSTGTLPFRASNAMELARMHVDVEPEPPRRREPSIPEGIERVILRCMKKSPAGRYQSAAEAAGELNRLLPEQMMPVIFVPGGAPRRTKRYLALAGALVLATACAAFFGWQLVKDRMARPPVEPAAEETGSVPAAELPVENARGRVPEPAVVPEAPVTPPAPLPGTVSVNVLPAGSKVYVDGEARGVTPADLSLEAGAYEIRVSESGFEDFTQNVTIGAGATAGVEASLVRKTARLRLESVPGGAYVFMDGDAEPKGRTPLLLEGVEPGAHSFVFRLEGYGEGVVRKDVAPGEGDLTCSLELLAGDVVVTSEPAGAAVYIGRTLAGTTSKPLERKGLPAGKHKIYFYKLGYEISVIDVSVNANETARVNAVLVKKPEWDPRNRLKLRTGGEVEGDIISSTQENVTVRTKTGSVTLRRADILWIETIKDKEEKK